MNRTLLLLSGALLPALVLWSFFFYINMLDEVRDSIDDGLENSKLLIIHEVEKDTTLLGQDKFAEGNYDVRMIPDSAAWRMHDVYKDTLMYMENEEDFEPVRLLTTSFRAANGRSYELKVISSMVEEDDLIEDLLYSLIWLYIIFVVLMFTVSSIVLRRVWSPFYSALEKLRKFRLGKGQKPVFEKSSIHEFRQLNLALEEMFAQSMQIYEKQKQFIENASHEIQTPLAIAMNKMQLLLERTDYSEEQLIEIASALSVLERMKRLNSSLLTLAKIENRQFNELKKISPAGICAEIVSDFEDIAAHRCIELTFSEEARFECITHPDLLQILFTNLIKNGIVHTPKNGKLSIISGVGQMVFSNSSSGEALNDKIFERFYKSKEDSASTGLGLSIVRSICEVEKIDLEYRFSGGNHVFVLKWHVDNSEL